MSVHNSFPFLSSFSRETTKSLGRRSRVLLGFLFSSPGVYACGNEAKIPFPFSFSPLQGAQEENEMSTMASRSTGVNAWASSLLKKGATVGLPSSALVSRWKTLLDKPAVAPELSESDFFDGLLGKRAKITPPSRRGAPGAVTETFRDGAGTRPIINPKSAI
jgi:hypothetical protein